MLSADGSAHASELTPASCLRILVTSEFPAWLSCGGTDHVAWQVASRAAAWGASVTLVTGRPASSRRTASSTTSEGVEVITLPSVDVGRRLGVELSMVPSGGRTLSRLMRDHDFDVVFANGLYFPITVQASAVARRTGTPLVAGAHVGRIDGVSGAVRTATTVYEHTIMRRTLRRAAAVIAVAENVGTEVRRLAPTARVHVIPNGVDSTRMATPSTHRVTATAEVRVIFVGRLIVNKGPHLALDAVNRLRADGDAVSLSFVGDGPMRPELERQVREWGLDDCVHFAGHVPDVASHLADADIFVRPSGSEGLPLAVLEAMAAGVCVVASDIPGNRELIAHDDNGLLVTAKDVPQLVSALRRLANDRPLRGRLAARARATAAGFTWDRTARETMSVLAMAARSPAS